VGVGPLTLGSAPSSGLSPWPLPSLGLPSALRPPPPLGSPITDARAALAADPPPLKPPLPPLLPGPAPPEPIPLFRSAPIAGKWSAPGAGIKEGIYVKSTGRKLEGALMSSTDGPISSLGGRYVPSIFIHCSSSSNDRKFELNALNETVGFGAGANFNFNLGRNTSLSFGAQASSTHVWTKITERVKTD